MKKYIHYKGKKIFYTDEGSGTAIMLIHGYLESADVWNGFAGRLVKKFRVLTVDLPGHGQSDLYGNTHTMEFLAETLNAIISGVGIEKVILIGHSLGGYVALAFLELFPEKLSGYCLFHSHPFADTLESLHKREREIRIVEAGKKFLMYPDNVKKMYAAGNLEKFSVELELSKKIASRIPAAGIVAVLKGMMARPSRLSLMEQGRVPCLWILGSKDNYIQCEDIQKRVKLPGNAKVMILENSGHLGFIEEEEKTAEIVVSFIREKC
jgi:pimeloyl-ACP methyl ester carboxylesterase